jgi:hypothetical protein
MTDNSVLPFSKESNEPDLAWAACLTYCLLPPDIRSVKKAQDEFYINKPTPTRKNGNASPGWEDWCRKFKWRERASIIDTKRATDFLSAEQSEMLKTKEDFNKLGSVKKENQLKLELIFSKWMDRGMKKGWFGDENEDSHESAVRIEQAAKIQKLLNESDGKLYDRVLKSTGIESLIPD